MRKREEPTQVENLLTRLKNIPVFARIIVFVLVVTAVLIAASTMLDHAPKKLSIFSPSKPAPAPFDAQVEVILQLPAPLFWVVNDEANHTYCPVPVPMFMDITNLQPSPAMLSEVTVEAQGVDGNWIRLPHVRFVRGAQLYMGSDPTKVGQVEANIVDQMIQDRRRLNPHVPLRGWMFFKNPLQSNFSKIRIRVKDTLGVEHTTGPLQALNTNVQTAPVILTGMKRDLTKLNVNYQCGD